MPNGYAHLSALALLLSSVGLSGEASALVQGEAREERSPLESWCSLDDPDAAGLPASLRSLLQVERVILQSPREPRFLLIRRVEGHASPYDAFSADEDSLGRFGEFIPVLDRIEGPEEDQVIIFDCEWTQETHSSQVSALYTPLEDGSTLAIWLITSLVSDFDELAREVIATLPHFRQSIAPLPTDSYSAILLGHEVHFELQADPRGRNPIRLEPAAVPLEKDTTYLAGVTGANPQFDAGIIRQWADEERGVSLSFQVIAHNTGLGTTEPFVHWLSGQYQSHLREDPEDGDTPVELPHVPGVLTEVISKEELARHYRANKRAPEAGVILQVFLPYSPFAEVRDLRWNGVEEETGEKEFAWIRFVELRNYRRSRSETILRSCNMLFIARARSRADLELLERELELTSRPLIQAESFPATQ